ncbi:phage tail protein [Aureimonas altamirensis]|uniref:phage tail tube protein n=1 Tax=Aureimonas altamirensis TaxID=370622 RepID=UPI001E651291|nr:phage tail tube protein [Aureimonas altamirensis]UHD44912.1 phage tail protein [Aureimonas altamirensis]
MAQPTTMKFGKFRVLLGNGASPEVFAAPCGFTQKSFTRTKELSDVVIPDCDDPDAMSHTARDARSLSASISGSGVMAKSAYPVWKAAYEDSDSINCRIEFDWDDDTTTITQRFHVSSLELSADLGDRVQISIQMESDGGYTEVTA